MLNLLIDHPEAEIVGIATKSQSQFNADHVNLSSIAEVNDIEYKYVKDINAPHILKWIKSLEPEVIYCFGWSSLIKKELLNLSNLGVIGYHPAELPMNRGRHPLIWALVLGLERTASTFFKMDEGADSGDILSQYFIPIERDDYAADLYKKIIESAKKQVQEFTHQLAKRQHTFTVQNHSKANLWRKRGITDGRIDFRMSSDSIYNLIRGLSKPYVGAHIDFQEKECKVWTAKTCDEVYPNFEAGKVLEINSQGAIKVVTGSSSIWLVEHEIPTSENIKYLF
jgi:methionyl-tRNA formyltransferase